MKRYGPNTDAVERGLARLRACRWLRPDAAMEALGDDARAWLRDRLDEHAAALSVATGGRFAAGELVTTRSMPEAAERWAARWGAPDGADAPPYATALRGAADLACDAAGALFGRDETMPLKRRIRARWFHAFAGDLLAARREALARSPAWESALGDRSIAEPTPEGPGTRERFNGRHPGELTAARHLVWLFAFGDDAARPSPWGPLFAVWERGAWPLALPDGGALVYVPLRRGDGIAPDPGDPASTRAPLRRPAAAVASSALPTLASLGCATAPLVERFADYRPPYAIMGEPAEVTAFPPEPEALAESDWLHAQLFKQPDGDPRWFRGLLSDGVLNLDFLY